MSSPMSDILVGTTPKNLLSAYKHGLFPMAESSTAKKLCWIDPPKRGVIPLNQVHISRSLRKKVRAQNFDIRVDTDFRSVIKGCAKKTKNRKDTWINPQIIQLYSELFELGYCHSVEAWLDNKLVGGLYGISLNGAFFGESMFSRATDASKVSLIYLIARLIYGKYSLLDTQFFSSHLKKFGAIEIMRVKFSEVLAHSMKVYGEFSKLPESTSGEKILKIIDDHSSHH